MFQALAFFLITVACLATLIAAVSLYYEKDKLTISMLLMAVVCLWSVTIIRPSFALLTSAEEEYLTVEVLNLNGVDNSERYFAFGDTCVLEHLGQTSSSGERIEGVRLEHYTAPEEPVTGDHCPTGTWYAIGPIE